MQQKKKKFLVDIDSNYKKINFDINKFYSMKKVLSMYSLFFLLSKMINLIS